MRETPGSSKNQMTVPVQKLQNLLRGKPLAQREVLWKGAAGVIFECKIQAMLANLSSSGWTKLRALFV